MNKKEIIKFVIQTIITILTAFSTTLGTATMI